MKKHRKAVLFKEIKGLTAAQPGTLLRISRPILPWAISRSAVTPGLFLLSILGAWPWLSMRARYVAASTSWKRFGICWRQSSTVMRAMDTPGWSGDVEGFESGSAGAALGGELQPLV